MKLSKRIAALSLALLLVLSACSQTGEDSGADSTPAASPSAAPTADPTSDDVCIATAGLPGDTVLFTVNGAPVTAQDYLYWLAYSVNYKESAMLAYGGSGIDWTATFNGTLSQSEYLKQDAQSSAVYWSLVASLAEEKGCALTEEEAAQLNDAIDGLRTQSGGEEAFAQSLRQACLNEQALFNLNAVPILSTKLSEVLFADRPTEEEMDGYIADNDLLYAKHILLMTIDPNTRAPLDEETIAAKAAAAQDLLAQLRESEDPLTLFDELMFANSEDTGLAANPQGYSFTAGQMVSEFEEATRALEYGQISDIVESDFGYHIILRLDPDTEANRQTFRSNLLDEQLQTWVGEAKIVTTPAYDALDAKVFHENLKALQPAGQ